MMRPLILRCLIPFTLVVLLLPACSDSGDEAANTTLAPTTTAAAVTISTTQTTTIADTETEVVYPVSYGPTLLVSGREDCDLNQPGGTWLTNTDGTVKFRDGEFSCTVTNSDPRIAGTAHYTLNMDRWGTSESTASHFMWGTVRIENDNGAWSGDYDGVYTGDLGDVFTVLHTGSDDYEGLSYYQWAVETFGSSWPTKGLIFPTASPDE